MQRTRVFPHVLLHEPVVRETFLADECVTRRRGVHRGLVVPEKHVGELIVPLLARRRERLLRGPCACVSVLDCKDCMMVSACFGRRTLHKLAL